MVVELEAFQVNQVEIDLKISLFLHLMVDTDPNLILQLQEELLQLITRQN